MADDGGGIYPNLFTACPPFQIDATFGLAAAIVEMLVQDHRGTIHLLPALPEILANGGGFRSASALWYRNVAVMARATSDQGGDDQQDGANALYLLRII